MSPPRMSPQPNPTAPPPGFFAKEGVPGRSRSRGRWLEDISGSLESGPVTPDARVDSPRRQRIGGLELDSP